MYGVALASTEVAAAPSPHFAAVIDWQLVVILAAFGLLGSLPRVDPIAMSPVRIWQQVSSGVVGGLVVGLWCAEVPWFQAAPRALLVVSIVAGYAGTSLLDAAAVRLKGRVGDDHA